VHVGASRVCQYQVGTGLCAGQECHVADTLAMQPQLLMRTAAAWRACSTHSCRCLGEGEKPEAHDVHVGASRVCQYQAGTELCAGQECHVADTLAMQPQLLMRAAAAWHWCRAHSCSICRKGDG
jgi:hypothetical protein